MTRNKVVIALMLILCVLLASCSKQTEDTTTTARLIDVQEDDISENVLKLPYSANDSLNPYYALSEVNSQLDYVLYQPLYKLDAAYNEVPVLAKSGSVNGNTVSIELNDAVFSDSTRVTSEDVVYSFNLAKKSTAYGSMLSYVKSATLGTTKTLIFELEGNNDFALSLLTFPIVKNATADSKDSVPVGSGPFVVDEGNRLKKSPTNTNAKIQYIELVDISKAINEIYVLQTGDVSFCFDSLQDGSYTKINAVTRSVLMNNMVYIGFNSNKKAFADPNIRCAVACAVDNEQIVQNAYRGNAVKTRIPFNPNWSRVKDINIELNAASAVSYLEKSGYNKLGYEGIRTDGETLLSFDLLVNSDNPFRISAANIVAEALNDLGFRVNVKQEKYEDYASDIASGKYDMYIGETKLGGDMGLYPFFKEGASLSRGVNPNTDCAKAYGEMLSSNTTVEAFCNSFIKEMPFAPLCFRTGVCASLRGVNLNVDTVKWYSDIENWSY